MYNKLSRKKNLLHVVHLTAKTLSFKKTKELKKAAIIHALVYTPKLFVAVFMPQSLFADVGVLDYNINIKVVKPYENKAVISFPYTDRVVNVG